MESTSKVRNKSSHLDGNLCVVREREILGEKFEDTMLLYFAYKKTILWFFFFHNLLQ